MHYVYCAMLFCPTWRAKKKLPKIRKLALLIACQYKGSKISRNKKIEKCRSAPHCGIPQYVMRIYFIINQLIEICAVRLWTKGTSNK